MAREMTVTVTKIDKATCNMLEYTNLDVCSRREWWGTDEGSRTGTET